MAEPLSHIYLAVIRRRNGRRSRVQKVSLGVKHMIGRVWAYLVLIAAEARRAYGDRRRLVLAEPVRTPERLIQECAEAARDQGNSCVPPYAPVSGPCHLD